MFKYGPFTHLIHILVLPSLVTQTVKNPPAMQKTQVHSLAREDPLEKEMATTLVFLPAESQGQRSLVGYSPWGLKELEMIEQLTHSVSLPVFKPVVSHSDSLLSR